MSTTSRYRIPSMDCSAEEQLVRMALAEVTGVEAVEIQLDSREVLVAHTTDRRGVDDALVGLGLGAAHLEDRDGGLQPDDDSAGKERSVLLLALAINALFFVGEVLFGVISRSMGLVADGLDMGADAAVYALSLAAVGAAAARKRRYARVSGFAQLALAFIGLAEVVRRIVAGSDAPDSTTMIVVTLLALVANVVVIVALRRVRNGDVHIEASWIFTANDVIVNLLVLAAAGAVAVFDSALPDLLAGTLIFIVVMRGASRILRLSRPSPT